MAYTRPIGPVRVTPDAGIREDPILGYLDVYAAPGTWVRISPELHVLGHTAIDTLVVTGNAQFAALLQAQAIQANDILSQGDIRAAGVALGSTGTIEGRRVIATGPTGDIIAARHLTAGPTGTVSGQTVTAGAAVTGSTVVGSTSVRGTTVYAGPSTTSPYEVSPSKAGRFAGSTNASGDVTITHGLGVTAALTYTLVTPTAPWFGDALIGVVQAVTATTVRIRWLYGTTPHASQAITFDWIAHPR